MKLTVMLSQEFGIMPWAEISGGACSDSRGARHSCLGAAGSRSFTRNPVRSSSAQSHAWLAKKCHENNLPLVVA